MCQRVCGDVSVATANRKQLSGEKVVKCKNKNIFPLKCKCDFLCLLLNICILVFFSLRLDPNYKENSACKQ